MKNPREYLAKIGRKGGKATGAGKRRGSREYYQAIARKRWGKRSRPTT